MNGGDIENNGNISNGVNSGLNTQSSTIEEDIMKPNKLLIYGCPPMSADSANTIMPLVFEHTAKQTKVDYAKGF